MSKKSCVISSYVNIGCLWLLSRDDHQTDDVMILRNNNHGLALCLYHPVSLFSLGYVSVWFSLTKRWKWDQTRWGDKVSCWRSCVLRLDLEGFNGFKTGVQWLHVTRSSTRLWGNNGWLCPRRDGSSRAGFMENGPRCGLIWLRFMGWSPKISQCDKCTF